MAVPHYHQQRLHHPVAKPDPAAAVPAAAPERFAALPLPDPTGHPAAASWAGSGGAQTNATKNFTAENITKILSSSNNVTIEFHGGFNHYGYKFRQSSADPKQWVLMYYTEEREKLLTTISHN